VEIPEKEVVDATYESPRLTTIGSVRELTHGPHDPHPAPPGVPIHHSR
jgi:hypothetical protein